MVAELIKPLVGSLNTKDSKPALGNVLPECPETYWDADSIDIDEWQAKYKAEDKPACPVEVVATPEDNAKGVAYFIERREEFKEMLAKHGTIWFRGFDLTKDPVGFRTFWEDGLAFRNGGVPSSNRAERNPAVDEPWGPPDAVRLGWLNETQLRGFFADLAFEAAKCSAARNLLPVPLPP